MQNNVNSILKKWKWKYCTGLCCPKGNKGGNCKVLLRSSSVVVVDIHTTLHQRSLLLCELWVLSVKRCCQAPTMTWNLTPPIKMLAIAFLEIHGDFCTFFAGLFKTIYTLFGIFGDFFNYSSGLTFALIPLSSPKFSPPHWSCVSIVYNILFRKCSTDYGILWVYDYDYSHSSGNQEKVQSHVLLTINRQKKRQLCSKKEFALTSPERRGNPVQPRGSML